MELVPVAAAFVPILVFILTYHVVARWWKTPEGQNVMTLAVLLMLFSLVILIRRAGHPDAARIMTDIIFYLVGVTFLWRTGLLLRAQGFLGRRERRHPHPDDERPGARG